MMNRSVLTWALLEGHLGYSEERGEHSLSSCAAGCGSLSVALAVVFVNAGKGRRAADKPGN